MVGAYSSRGEDVKASIQEGTLSFCIGRTGSKGEASIR